MITFNQYTQVNEGVNDPAIFKAVFLAGGPGSGKSFVVGKTALQPIGFKLINSDPAFESALKKANLTTSPEDIASEKGQEARAKAKSLTKKQMELALNGRLGLVIDGTGKDLDKITKQAIALRKIGYDVAMIFVNTDEATAQSRNQMRSRTLPKSMVSKMWNDVQSNIGSFQAFFGNFFVIDNSEGSDYNTQTNDVYKKILEWSKKTPNNSAVSSWMKTQKNSVNEETWEEEDSRLASAGVEGYNKAKRTPSHPTKSHIVVAKDGDKVKTIRFGEQGASTAGEPKKGESDKMKAKRKSFKARHGKNIAKGKMSAAYWADKEKW